MPAGQEKSQTSKAPAIEGQKRDRRKDIVEEGVYMHERWLQFLQKMT